MAGVTAAAVEDWKHGLVAGLENHSNEEKNHGNYHEVSRVWTWGWSDES